MHYVNSLKMKTLLRSAFIFQNKSHVHRLIKQYSDLSNRYNNSITFIIM